MSAHPREPGEVFLDARGGGRAMRLTWHHEADLVVLSMWRDHVCTGTFRLAAEDVSDFVDTLVDGLRGAPALSVSRPGGPAFVESALTGQSPPGLPRQRMPGSHAARTSDRPAGSDWAAFGRPGAHRATAS
jgi:hypothetical protein